MEECGVGYRMVWGGALEECGVGYRVLYIRKGIEGAWGRV